MKVLEFLGIHPRYGLNLWVLHFLGKRNEFSFFGHPKIFYFEILGSPNLNLCLRPAQLNEMGQGQDIFWVVGRLWISLSCIKY